MDRTPTIRRAGVSDTERLAEVLAAAFEHDPVMTWMLPGADSRRHGVHRLFRLLVLSRLEVDRDGYLTEHGAAIWAPPGAWRLSVGQQLRAFPRLVRSVGRHLPRAISGTATLERHHPDEPAHWYLEALGVRPGHQGHGIGTRLLEPMLATCDADRLPVYLETATERNLVFYQRLGFRVREEFDLGNGPHIWTMWRNPGARA
jgi:GNAT superfamily N-acetyltransferase